MKIDIITLFPEMFKGPFDESIIKRAQDKSFGRVYTERSECAQDKSFGSTNKPLIEINIHNLRKWTADKRGTVDDRPYGGGVGMVMMIEPLAKAIKSIKSEIRNPKSETKTILLSPRGKVWKQEIAQKYSKLDHLILICGHYEGVDERIREFIDEEISIGDFVLTGGEIPSMVLVDSIVRLIPGVLEKPESIQFESFSKSLNPSQPKSLLEYPQYTHPEDFRDLKVPSILLSGDHGKIEKWREEKALEITKKNRPDLIKD